MSKKFLSRILSLALAILMAFSMIQPLTAHVHTMEEALDGMSHSMQQWDEEMIRQLVHTVKVISADHIKVFLYDGTEIDQIVGYGSSTID